MNPVIIILVSVFALAAGITAKVAHLIVNADPVSHKMLVAAAFLLISAAILFLIAAFVPAYGSDGITCEFLFHAQGWDVVRCKGG